MTNIQKARTSGLEVTATIPLTKNLNWRNNVTYMAEAKNLTTGANLLFDTEAVVVLGAGLAVRPPVVRRKYGPPGTGKELDGGKLAEKPKSTGATVVSYKVTPQWTEGGVQNLFRKRPHGPRPGRLLRAGTPYVCRPDVALSGRVTVPQHVLRGVTGPAAPATLAPATPVQVLPAQ